MIQKLGVGNPELAANTTEPQVACCKYKPADTRGDQCTCAHHARFEGYVHLRVFQPVIRYCGGCFPKRHHLSMGSGINLCDWGITAPPHDQASSDDNRSHGDLAFACGFARQFQRLNHERFVGHIITVRRNTAVIVKQTLHLL